MFQFLYLSIGMHFILFHVEFEDRLSISILKNMATWYKNLQLEIEEKSKCVLFGCPSPFSSYCVRGGQPRLYTPLHTRAYKTTRAYLKKQSHGDGFI
jgi:hypothetical protein